MAKGNGTTRASSPSANSKPQTFEEQVDSALVGLRGEFFDRMDDFYENSFDRWQKRFEEWKEKEDYIYQGQSSVSAVEANRREREIYGENYRGLPHYRIGNDLRDEYSDLTSGGYYTGNKAPTFWDIKAGRGNISQARQAVKDTAQRNAEKKFAEVRSKMLKSTVEKGIDLSKAKVQSASGDGFLISDGKITLHARYILAWGEIKAPHFRFIITDRKS